MALGLSILPNPLEISMHSRQKFLPFDASLEAIGLAIETEKLLERFLHLEIYVEKHNGRPTSDSSRDAPRYANTLREDLRVHWSSALPLCLVC